MTGDDYELGSRKEVTAGNLSQAEVPRFWKVKSSSGEWASNLQPATALSLPTLPFSPSKGWAFLGILGVTGGGGAAARAILNLEALLSQPLRPEFPCHLLPPFSCPESSE